MKIIVVYNSKTGFTERYANFIADSLKCEKMPFLDVDFNLGDYDLIIFGTRLVAGKIEGLSFLKDYDANKVVLFVTGATPNAAVETIEKMFVKNLKRMKLTNIPHFYMQSGICIEQLPIMEQMMLQVASLFMKLKKNKTLKEQEFEKAIASSFDILSPEYALPLINYVRSINEKE